MKISMLTILLLLFTFVNFVVGQSSGDEYRGFRHKAVRPDSILPNGLKLLGSGVIGKTDAEPVYYFSIAAKGKVKMLWLEISVFKESGGLVDLEVKDVLWFSSQQANEDLLFPNLAIECSKNKNENLFGIGKIDYRKGVFHPSRLWAADLKKEKFEPVSTTGIECVYSGP